MCTLHLYRFCQIALLYLFCLRTTLWQYLAGLWAGKRTLSKCLNHILKSFKDDDSISYQLHWPRLSWRRRHVKCLDFKARREWERRKVSKVGGDEKANIYYVSSMSRCCDTHVTYVTYGVLGIIIMAPAGIGLGLWAQTQTRWAGLRTKHCQRQYRCYFSDAKIRATFSAVWRQTQFHSRYISLR